MRRVLESLGNVSLWLSFGVEVRTRRVGEAQNMPHLPQLGCLKTFEDSMVSKCFLHRVLSLCLRFSTMLLK